VYVYKPNVCAQ